MYQSCRSYRSRIFDCKLTLVRWLGGLAALGAPCDARPAMRARILARVAAQPGPWTEGPTCSAECVVPTPASGARHVTDTSAARLSETTPVVAGGRVFSALSSSGACPHP